MRNIFIISLYFRYIAAIGAQRETEVENLRQVLLLDTELQRVVDLVCGVLEASTGGAWGSFMGFREVARLSLYTQGHI